MDFNDLRFDFPESLIATEPSEPCRVLLSDHTKALSTEINFTELLSFIEPGDLFVFNNSGVKPCRIFHEGKEVLFLKPMGENKWEVLFASSKLNLGDSFSLPGGIIAKLLQKGRPQVLQLSESIGLDYFSTFGDFALPPYIQRARGQRRPLENDQDWYQSNFFKNQESFAAPTAGLHFRKEHLDQLKKRGVKIAEVTLNVGLGTFLPVDEEKMKTSSLHSESISVPMETTKILHETRESGGRIWALGTTSLRTLESLPLDHKDGFEGETTLFIKPGYEFKWVSGLLTNFHQPESSLLALVMAFSGVSTVKTCYAQAIREEFRLFSYGDLSVWTRPKP